MCRWSSTRNVVSFARRVTVICATVCLIGLMGCGSEEVKTDAASNKTDDSKVASAKSETPVESKTQADGPTPSPSNPVPPPPGGTAKVAAVDRAFDLIPAESFAAIVVRPQQIVEAPIFAGAIDQAAKEYEEWKTDFQRQTGLAFDSVEAVVVVSWPDLQDAPPLPETNTPPLDGPKLPELPGGSGACLDEVVEAPADGDEDKGESTPPSDPTLPPILEEPSGFGEPEELPFPAAGGAIVLLSADITLDDLGIGGESQETDGKTFFVKDELAYSLIDSKTIAISSETGIQKILTAKGDSVLGQQLAGLDLTAPVTVTVNKEQAGDLVELFAEPPVAPMLASVSTVTLTIGLTETVSIGVTLDANNADLPMQLQSMAEQGIAEGKSAAKAMLPLLLSSSLGDALAQSAAEVALATLDSVKLSAEGNRFTLSFVIPKDAGDLIPQLVVASLGSSESSSTSSEPILPPTPEKGPSLPPEPNPLKDLD